MTPKIEQWKKIKKEKGLTNRDIANISGLPLGSIKNIFAGYTDNPRLDTIQAIERALGIDSLTWTTEEYGNGVQDVKKIFVTADEDELLYLYKEIGQRKGRASQKLILDMMKTILKDGK